MFIHKCRTHFLWIICSHLNKHTFMYNWMSGSIHWRNFETFFLLFHDPHTRPWSTQMCPPSKQSVKRELVRLNLVLHSPRHKTMHVGWTFCPTFANAFVSKMSPWKPGWSKAAAIFSQVVRQLFPVARQAVSLHPRHKLEHATLAGNSNDKHDVCFLILECVNSFQI